MKVYRISRHKYIYDLSGIGAKLYGGRWNPKGYSLLYTSENKSLAALELLVHLNKNTIPNDLKLLSLILPDEEIKEFDEQKFKHIIKQDDASLSLKQEGQNWLESQISLSLIVPSILIPGEKNILINPTHKSFEKIEVISIEDFFFDERFFI